GEFLRKDFDRGLDLVSDAVLHPVFPDDEVRKLIAQRTDGVKAMKDNPQSAIGAYYQAFFFGPNHPYGRPADEASLSRINRSTIQKFHAQNYCGRNLVVIVTGDFDLASARTKIAAAFGSAPAGTAFEWPTAAPPESKTHLLLIDKPDATQTYF